VVSDNIIRQKSAPPSVRSNTSNSINGNQTAPDQPVGDVNDIKVSLNQLVVGMNDIKALLKQIVVGVNDINASLKQIVCGNNSSSLCQPFNEPLPVMASSSFNPHNQEQQHESQFHNKDSLFGGNSLHEFSENFKRREKQNPTFGLNGLQLNNSIASSSSSSSSDNFQNINNVDFAERHLDPHFPVPGYCPDVFMSTLFMNTTSTQFSQSNDKLDLLNDGLNQTNTKLIRLGNKLDRLNNTVEKIDSKMSPGPFIKHDENEENQISCE
jgi:methyl-accepting chemotaxis protein